MSKKSELNKLKKIWYKKLKDEGFEDIEPHENTLKRWTSYFNSPRALELAESRQEYYYMANQFLNEYKFETALEKTIWEYHSNAISYRNITKLLKQVKIKETNRTSIGSIIKRLRSIMFKTYLHNPYAGESFQ